MPFPELDPGGVLAEKSSTAIARVIRRAILDGTFEPGRALREEELAESLGISRTPVREALLILENEGLVDSVRNRTTRVSRFDPAGLEEVYSIRAVLEGLAARQAAERITTEELEGLEASAGRYRELAKREDKLAKLAEENLTFHEMIHGAARNARLRRMIQTVTALPLIYRSYMTYAEPNRRKASKDHDAILKALKARDVKEAGRFMEQHVEWARDVAVANLIDDTASADKAVAAKAG